MYKGAFMLFQTRIFPLDMSVYLFQIALQRLNSPIRSPSTSYFLSARAINPNILLLVPLYTIPECLERCPGRRSSLIRLCLKASLEFLQGNDDVSRFLGACPILPAFSGRPSPVLKRLCGAHSSNIEQLEDIREVITRSLYHQTCQLPVKLISLRGLVRLMLTSDLLY